MSITNSKIPLKLHALKIWDKILSTDKTIAAILAQFLIFNSSIATNISNNPNSTRITPERLPKGCSSSGNKLTPPKRILTPAKKARSASIKYHAEINLTPKGPLTELLTLPLFAFTLTQEKSTIKTYSNHSINQKQQIQYADNQK